MAVAILAVGSVAACGAAGPGERSGDGDRALVAYSREGGIRFQASRLVVSTKRMVVLQSEGCEARFRLDSPFWQRLQSALAGADLATLAGEYSGPSGAADAIEETIIVGSDAVRIADFSSLPSQVQRRLTPLLTVFTQILAKGVRRPSRTC